jgi:hypothetical protein
MGNVAPLSRALKVINIGLESFAQDLISHGVEVVHVDWAPPAGADPYLAGILAQVYGLERIETANAEAARRILSAEPVLVDVNAAGTLIPSLNSDRIVLHAGPPITWKRMCGPMRGAICGAIVLEEWAPDLVAAGWRLPEKFNFTQITILTWWGR